MIDKYAEYLAFLDANLHKKFENQKTFIKCKKGCAHCCRNGVYPMSELEFVYMMMYFNILEESVKQEIERKIKILIDNKPVHIYECPFLINEECSVYPARSIICRAFGLMTFDKKNKFKVPFCSDLGLNFAEAFEDKNSKYLQPASDGTIPVAYNIERPVLRSKEIENSFGIFFGEDKSMVDWLIDFYKGTN